MANRDKRQAEPRVSVILPTLREAENLPHVLPRVPDWIHELVLVDAHSDDDTVAVARRLRPDVRVVYQERAGKGDALTRGLEECTGEIAVLLDADGSTDPGEIPRFVEAVAEGAQLAKGSRFLGDGGSDDITHLRSLGNKVLTKLVNLLFGTSYTDLCYGYNALRVKDANRLSLDAPGFEIESLMGIRAATEGLDVVEVPSWEHRRIHGDSNLNAVRDGTRVLRTILSERVDSALGLAKSSDTLARWSAAGRSAARSARRRIRDKEPETASARLRRRPRRLPDFYIVGAPKAGTTALHLGLSNHPDIHLASSKDVPSPYVGTDLPFRRWALSPEEYSRQLPPEGSGHIGGETCVWYLYSRRAADEIATLCPDARIVMVLRNPVEMIMAQHEQFLYNGNETIEDVAQALAAEPARSRGLNIPKSAHFPEGLRYVETARYAEQVRRYLEAFPRDQLSIYLFEDLQADPDGVVAAILEHVGASPSSISLPRANAAKEVRHARLQRLLMTPPRPLEKGYHLLVPERFYGRVAEWGIRRNVAKRSRPPLDPALRRRLVRQLEGDVRELAGLLERDLGGWLVDEPPPEVAEAPTRAFA